MWAYFKTIVDVGSELAVEHALHVDRPWQHVHCSLPDDYYMQKCGLDDLKDVFDKISLSTDSVSKALIFSVSFLNHDIKLLNSQHFKQPHLQDLLSS